MNVLVAASNGYACTWNRPCSFSRKMNVNALNAKSVPNQTNLVPWTWAVGRKTSSCNRRTRLFTPSAATTRSPSGSDVTSWKKRRSTPSSRHRSWRIIRSCLRAMPENACPRERTVSPRYLMSMAFQTAKLSVMRS